MLQLVDAVVVKNRYIYQGWEIDSFETNDGEPFCVAEWEESANGRPAPSPLPDWIVRDVTEELQYTNQSIAWNGVPDKVTAPNIPTDAASLATPQQW